MTAPLVLGIAGGTASGKTTVARKLHEAGQETRPYAPVLLDGLPGYLSLERGDTMQATALDIRDGRIVAIYVVRNPDKLGRARERLMRAAAS